MLRPLLQGLAVNNRVLEDSAVLMRQTLLTRPNLEEGPEFAYELPLDRPTDLSARAE